MVEGETRAQGPEKRIASLPFVLYSSQQNSLVNLMWRVEGQRRIKDTSCIFVIIEEMGISKGEVGWGIQF